MTVMVIIIVMVQCSAVQCRVGQCSGFQCNGVQCSAVKRSARKCSSKQYCTELHYTTPSLSLSQPLSPSKTNCTTVLYVVVYDCTLYKTVLHSNIMYYSVLHWAYWATKCSSLNRRDYISFVFSCSNSRVLQNSFFLLPEYIYAF